MIADAPALPVKRPEAWSRNKKTGPLRKLRPLSKREAVSTLKTPTGPKTSYPFYPNVSNAFLTCSRSSKCRFSSPTIW